MNTRAAVEELLVEMGSGDARAISSLFTPDVDFSCAREDPWLRPRYTRADMESFFDEIYASFVPDDREASVTQILVDGEDAVVVGRVTQRLRSNGVVFTIPFALHLTVTEDGISRYHVYEDSLTVANAVATRK